MPLYLADCFESPGPERLFSVDAFLALLFIQFENEKVALTPRSAWSAVSNHLLPLLPQQIQATYAQLQIKSWRDFHFVYIDLLGESKGKNLQILAVANAIEAVFQHSTRPPRELEFPQFIEVTYFLNSCDLLKLSVRKDVAPDHLGNAEVFRFCKYCWRIALPNRQACPIHSPGKNLSAMVLPPFLHLESTTPSGRYKEGYRQKEKFDSEVSKLLSQEIFEFHNSGLSANVLFPSNDWLSWLTKRRPKLDAILTKFAPNTPNDHIPRTLVTLLHNSENLSPSVQANYLYVNQLLIQDRRLMWPMLLRAECWLAIRQKQQQSWGGKREKSNVIQQLPNQET